MYDDAWDILEISYTVPTKSLHLLGAFGYVSRVPCGSCSGMGYAGRGLVHAPIGALRLVELLCIPPGTCATGAARAK